MAFGNKNNNGGTKPQDRSNRTDDQNNPADNPNRKDRDRSEDDVLKDQGNFESEALNQDEEVETPGGDARTADEANLA